ncbi:hypothetical protein A9Q83_05470 [Alphaproteobacteria bacterium 46_93_T64]|nr:hypothetical protein A9Q83_05470 [Alphaproteobacteria bacterium 46_93_T64]
MAALLFTSGRIAEALLHFMRATVQRSDDPVILMNIGFCLSSLGVHREAVRYFRATLDLGHESKKLIEKLIESLSQINRIDDANSLLEKYQNTPLATRRMLLSCAANLHLKGDLETAKEVVERARLKEPENAFTQVTNLTLEAAISNDGNSKVEPRKRVAFHLNEAFHLSIMKPIFDALKSEYEVIMTADPNWIREFQPALIFVANQQANSLRMLVPEAKFVYTRHGLISKNFVYNAAKRCDYVCVSSNDQRQQFIEQGNFRPDQVWVTGYAQMDALFWDKELPTGLPLRKERKCILYAPTFTGGLTSLPMVLPILDTEFFEKLGDVDFVIKPHPLTSKANPDWTVKLKEIEKLFPNVHLVDDAGADVVPLLKRADLLVSDVSSVMFQFLALDRPIVAINNPDRFKVKEYDPVGIEWRWRDMAVEIGDMAILGTTINECLSNPSLKSAERALYRASLFGSLTDGKTGPRTLKYVREILPGKVRALDD